MHVHIVRVFYVFYIFCHIIRDSQLLQGHLFFSSMKKFAINYFKISNFTKYISLII